jgi:nucleotide-binding universal stress UspA family protein
MTTIEAGARVALKKILYLTDLSEPSEVALPFAEFIAREYEAKMYALHVLIPFALAYTTPESAAAMIEGQEEQAQDGIRQLESQLAGLPHESIVERGVKVWPSVERVITCCMS